MSSTISFFIFIPLLAFILLDLNLIFAPHNPYKEKDSVFECGFHSFLGQNRTQFSISFFIFALLFLLFDLEILLLVPYIVSGYNNSTYGLVSMLFFIMVLTVGFAFELGKKALNIESKQQQQQPQPHPQQQQQVIEIFKQAIIYKLNGFFNKYNNNLANINLLSFCIVLFNAILKKISIEYIFDFFFNIYQYIANFILNNQAYKLITDLIIYAYKFITDIALNPVIYLYIFNCMLYIFLCLLFSYVLKKLLTSKPIIKYLQPQFAFMLTVKVKLWDIINNIFSYKYMKRVILNSSLVLLPHIISYLYWGSFIHPFSLGELFTYIAYIAICINISNCYIYDIKLFTKFNICCLIYCFSYIFMAKLTLVSLTPIIIAYIYCIEPLYIVNMTAIYNKPIKLLNNIPIIHKFNKLFLFINKNNYTSNLWNKQRKFHYKPVTTTKATISYSELSFNKSRPIISNIRIMDLIKEKISKNISIIDIIKEKRDKNISIIDIIYSAEKISYIILTKDNHIYELFTNKYPNINLQILCGVTKRGLNFYSDNYVYRNQNNKELIKHVNLLKKKNWEDFNYINPSNDITDLISGNKPYNDINTYSDITDLIPGKKPSNDINTYSDITDLIPGKKPSNAMNTYIDNLLKTEGVLNPYVFMVNTSNTYADLSSTQPEEENSSNQIKYKIKENCKTSNYTSADERARVIDRNIKVGNMCKNYPEFKNLNLNEKTIKVNLFKKFVDINIEYDLRVGVPIGNIRQAFLKSKDKGFIQVSEYNELVRQYCTLYLYMIDSKVRIQPQAMANNQHDGTDYNSQALINNPQDMINSSQLNNSFSMPNSNPWANDSFNMPATQDNSLFTSRIDYSQPYNSFMPNSQQANQSFINMPNYPTQDNNLYEPFTYNSQAMIEPQTMTHNPQDMINSSQPNNYFMPNSQQANQSFTGDDLPSTQPVKGKRLNKRNLTKESWMNDMNDNFNKAVFLSKFVIGFENKGRVEKDNIMTMLMRRLSVKAKEMEIEIEKRKSLTQALIQPRAMIQPQAMANNQHDGTDYNSQALINNPQDMINSSQLNNSFSMPNSNPWANDSFNMPATQDNSLFTSRIDYSQPYNSFMPNSQQANQSFINMPNYPTQDNNLYEPFTYNSQAMIEPQTMTHNSQDMINSSQPNNYFMPNSQQANQYFNINMPNYPTQDNNLDPSMRDSQFNESNNMIIPTVYENQQPITGAITRRTKR